jgi:hypothetical protein
MGSKLGTLEYLGEIQSALSKSIGLISKSVNNLPMVNDDVSMSFTLMTGSIIDTSHSMLILSNAGKLRDVYALSRIVFDLTLNVGYFSVKGKEAVRLSLQHYHQKAFRDLSREIEISGLKFGIGIKDFDKVAIDEKLREALDFFTNKKGFEIRSWTGENVFKKIELIIEKYGEDIGLILIINLFFIYRHSSEIIHGTMFGSLFARGMTRPEAEQPNDEDELEKFHITYISFNLICVLLLNYVVFEIIHKHYPREADLKELKEIIKNFNITLS